MHIREDLDKWVKHGLEFFFFEMEGWTFGPPSVIVGTDLSQFFA